MLIMTGVHGAGGIERVLADARQAITRDIVERALGVAGVSQIILSTNSRTLARWARSRGVAVELDPPQGSFHFGNRLREIALAHGAQRILYMGGGTGALLQTADIARIVRAVGRADSVLLTNNYYSTDFAAFAPASVLDTIDLPAIDNDLGWVLGEKAGLPNQSLERTAATQLDVDTPTDLMALAAHPGVGPHTRAFLDGLEFDTSHLERALGVLVDRQAEILVAGRVSSSTWGYLERETACRVRVFAEERGMRASGRQARGEARSLLGYYYQQVGAQHFFDSLASMCQAIFLDSRVVFSHLGVWPPADDRYNSDLLRPQLIGDETVRTFTEAALSARVPVVLGGHSLVSGGMYALVEAAWVRSAVNVPRYVDHRTWGEPGSGQPQIS